MFLPGESHEQRSLAGYSLAGHRESDTTEWLHFSLSGFSPRLLSNTVLNTSSHTFVPSFAYSLFLQTPLLMEYHARDFGGNKNEPVPALSESPSCGKRKTRKTRFLRSSVLEHMRYWARTRDVEASLRKGIFSAVDVLARKTEGRASQARSREKQFLEAEPNVAQSRSWWQKHSADRAGESGSRLWEPGGQGLRLLGQGVCSQPSA